MRISDWSSDVCSSDLVPKSRRLHEVHVVTNDNAQIRDQLHVAWQVDRELRGDRLKKIVELPRQVLVVGCSQTTTRQLHNCSVRRTRSHGGLRSEEVRGGEEWCSTCRSRGSPSH